MTSSTRPSTCWPWSTTGSRGKIDLGKADHRHFVFSCGAGIDATVVKRVDAHPRLKSAAGPYYFSWAAISAFYRSYLYNPVRLRCRPATEAGGGRHRPRPELRPLHLLRQPPGTGLRGGRDRRRHACAGRAQAGHPARHADPDVAPLQRTAAGRPPPPDRAVQHASPRPPSPRSRRPRTGSSAPSRSRSTATTSARRPSSSCAASRAH